MPLDNVVAPPVDRPAVCGPGCQGRAPDIETIARCGSGHHEADGNAGRILDGDDAIGQRRPRPGRGGEHAHHAPFGALDRGARAADRGAPHHRTGRLVVRFGRPQGRAISALRGTVRLAYGLLLPRALRSAGHRRGPGRRAGDLRGDEGGRRDLPDAPGRADAAAAPQCPRRVRGIDASRARSGLQPRDGQGGRADEGPASQRHPHQGRSRQRPADPVGDRRPADRDPGLHLAGPGRPRRPSTSGGSDGRTSPTIPPPAIPPSC